MKHSQQIEDLKELMVTKDALRIVNIKLESQAQPTIRAPIAADQETIKGS